MPVGISHVVYVQIFMGAGTGTQIFPSSLQVQSKAPGYNFSLALQMVFGLHKC